ncbi:hypothetical protein [Coleofasciculus sp.]
MLIPCAKNGEIDFSGNLGESKPQGSGLGVGNCAAIATQMHQFHHI